MIPLFKRSDVLQIPALERHGALVTIRPPRADDVAQWISVRGRNHARLKPFEPTWKLDSLTAEFFSRRLARQAAEWRDDRHYAFLIFRQDTNALVGGVNVNNVCRGAAQFASIGYWIDGASEGKGYMSDALRALIPVAFNDLRLHRLNAAILPHNDRSRHLLERVGFVEEGFAPSYLEIDGQWQDHILFGLIKQT